MLEFNGKILTNQEIVEKLGEKITKPIVFQLCDQFKSSIKLIHRGESKWTERWVSNFGLRNEHQSRNFDTGGTDQYVYYTTATPDQINPQIRRFDVNGNGNKVSFTGGMVTISQGQEDLLLFLRAHEQNQTNKYFTITDERGKQKHFPKIQFLFKEIIPEMVNELKYDNTHERLKAQTAAFDPKRIPYEAAVVMATAYGMTEARHTGEKNVRQFLYDNASKNPSLFLSNMTNSSFDIKAQLQSAVEFGIVSFDAPYWKWSEKKTGDARICSVPTGEDKLDYFVQWMREVDKSGVLEQVKQLVEKAMEGADEKFIKEEIKPLDAVLIDLGFDSLEDAKKMKAELEQFRREKAKADKAVAGKQVKPKDEITLTA